MNAFVSLRNRNYRLFLSGQAVSNTGTWMQRTAQDWLILSLSHNSGLALGIVTGLQFLPVLLLVLYGGVIADRYDKRTILVVTQTSMGGLAVILAVLDLVGVAQLWHVYVLAACLGVATAFDNPVRQAFVHEMVGEHEVSNAVSLNSATFNLARVVGPAIAGLLISGIGTGWAFALNAASFGAVIIGLRMMRADELVKAPLTPRAKGQLREGLSYVRERDELLLPLILLGVVGTVGMNFPVTIALMAKITFHQGAGSYGLLSSALAVGSVIGALAAAQRSGRGIKPRRRTYLLGGFLFGICETAAGLMPSYLTFALLLIPTGLTFLIFSTAVNSTLQMGSDPQFRGRVMGVFMLVFLGGTPIGAPLIGILAEHYGPRSSIVVGGVTSALAAVGGAIYVIVRSKTRDDVVDAVGERPHISRIDRREHADTQLVPAQLPVRLRIHNPVGAKYLSHR